MSKVLHSNELTTLLHEYFSPEEILANRYMGAIATSIEIWRHNHGMSQPEFAELLGVPLRTVERWERGEYNFTIQDLARFQAKTGDALIWARTITSNAEDTP